MAPKQHTKILQKFLQMSSKGLVSMYLHMHVHRAVCSPTCIHTAPAVKIDSPQLSEGGVSSTQHSTKRCLLRIIHESVPRWKCIRAASAARTAPCGTDEVTRETQQSSKDQTRDVIRQDTEMFQYSHAAWRWRSSEETGVTVAVAPCGRSPPVTKRPKTSLLQRPSSQPRTASTS